MDYLLSNGNTGPRAGFNPAGWIAWALGFTVCIFPNLGINCPASPVLAAAIAASPILFAPNWDCRHA